MLFDSNIIFGCFARGIIRRKARLLVGRAGFSRDDREDIEQELLLRLLQSIPLLDPNRGHPNVFITTIVDLGSGQQNFHQGVQIMVSTDASAREWKYSVPVDMPRMVDNPEPTVTSDKVVITTDECVWVVDKQALIGGNAPVVQPRVCDIAHNNQVAATKYGGDPPATAYAITMSDSTHINWLSTEGPAANAKVTQHLLELMQAVYERQLNRAVEQLTEILLREEFVAGRLVDRRRRR